MVFVVFCAALRCASNLAPHASRLTASTHGTYIADGKMMMSNFAVVCKELDIFGFGFVPVTYLREQASKPACSERNMDKRGGCWALAHPPVSIIYKYGRDPACGVTRG